MPWHRVMGWADLPTCAVSLLGPRDLGSRLHMVLR